MANLNENVKLNFKSKMRKMQTRLDMWKARSLTLFGKTVIKSLALSQLFYTMSMLEEPVGDLDLITKIVVKFLWNGKPDKIKRKD